VEGRAVTVVATSDVIRQAREALRLDPSGRPACGDSILILRSIESLLRTHHADAIEEILLVGFLGDSERRYEEHLAPSMRSLGPTRFTMGTDRADARHFHGESPAHPVTLSPFLISSVAVTNELYGLIDRDRLEVRRADRRRPAVGVTWFDASLFALWVGCRMPTEAEWEYCCGAGSPAEWCCEVEADLARFAWYCLNSGGTVRPVGTRAPNTLDLFDLHGNVWEWCQDAYDQDWYERTPRLDPVCRPGAAHHAVQTHRVTRGGSFHGLPEMCRTRYRFHEPAAFYAADLGFRVARSEERAPWVTAAVDRPGLEEG
jgi:formylglycine-generating enzyme required for sulfatase activity